MRGVKMSNNLGIKKEVDVLRKALKEDEGYYISWQANIAMQFKDEYGRKMEELGTQYNSDIIHEVANTAAKNFLDLLIKD
jgi:transposase